jgi:Protein of unknown function (DUF2796)
MRRIMQTSYGCAALASLALFALPAGAQDPRRELGAHVHGSGALDVAIEGNRVVMVLRAPGADVLGFEGKAETPDAKAKLAAATALLEKPLALFRVPEAAKCTVVSAKITIDDDEDDHVKPEGPAAKDAPPPAKDAHGDHDHSDVQADYELACANPGSVTAIDFAYFAAFPKALKIAVQIVTAKGQSADEATPAKPRVDLSALVK